MKQAVPMLLVMIALWPAFAAAAPVHVHITTEGDPGETVTITWQTPLGVTAGAVEYGPNSAYGSTATAVSHTYAGASGLIWDAVLTGLTTDTAYHYHCGADSDGWSADHAFRTAPAPGSPITFIALGDSRTNLDIWAALTSQILQNESPALVLHDGDFVISGDSQTDWDAFFDNAAGLLAQTILIPAEGNHDVGSMMYQQFALPSNGGNGEKYFSFNWGDLHVLVLNTETGSGDMNGPQAAFIASDLAAAAGDPWKIALYHRGFYTCGNHNGEMNPYKPTWLTPMEDAEVDACFNGHDHFYQRTLPIRGDLPQAEYGVEADQGVCHVVAGAAGAPLYTVGSCWWIAYGQSVYHYCRITIDGDAITIVAIDISGNVIDTVSWSKALPSPTPTATLTPTFTPALTATPTATPLQVIPSTTPAGLALAILALSGCLAGGLARRKSS